MKLRGYPNTLVKGSGTALGKLDEWRFVDTLLRDADPERSLRIPRGSSLYVRGWALLPDPPRPARGVIIVVNDDVWFETAYRRPRRDIAAAIGGPGTGECGYASIGKFAGLSVGWHHFVVVVLGENDTYYDLARQNFEVIPSREQLAHLTRAEEGRMQIQIDDVATLRDPNAFARDTLSAKIGDVICVRGWAVDLEAQTGPAGIFGVFDGEECVMGVHGLPRDDVAEAFAAPRANKSGFTLRMPTQMIAPGVHSLDVALVASDGRSYVTHHVAEFQLTKR
jgi:hypothetical protein